MQQAFHGELPCSEFLLAAANEAMGTHGAFLSKPAHKADWYASC